MKEVIAQALDAVKRFVRSEPSVVIGGVASAALYLQPTVEGVSTWESAVPLLLSAIIRHFVSPAR